MVKYLLEHGAKVDVTDEAGKTPIDAAKSGGNGSGHPEIVTLLTSRMVAR